jgi:hypothetical protein
MRQGRPRAVRHGAVLAGWLFLGYLFLVVAPSTGLFGLDAFSYWVVDPTDPYAIPWGTLGAFNYAPPIAIALGPLGGLDWWVFLFLWSMLLVGSVIWIGWQPGWVIVAFAIPFVALELLYGNIHILLAVAVLLGFQHPWTWSFVLLTKPSSGIGLLWFVVRREWRSLAIALGATALVSGLSFLVAPGLWAEWFEYVSRYTGTTPLAAVVPVPLWLRLPAAALLVTWGALTDRRWTVVVATCLALPALWVAGLSMLVGIIPELRDGRQQRATLMRSAAPAAA